MKQIDGKQAIIEILKIGKEIYKQNEKIRKSGIFGKNVDIDILRSIDIDNIIAKLTGNTIMKEEAIEINKIYQRQGINFEYLSKEGDTPDWIVNVIFDYYEDKRDLQELVNTLIES